jgi:hypothetical protein
MNQHTISEADIRLWNDVVEAERKFVSARMKLFKSSTSLVELVREELSNPTERTVAINVASLLKPNQLELIFDRLIALASFSHGQTANICSLLLSLPHDWVLANIETYAEPLLKDGTYEEYRRLLELYSQIDSALTRRLAKRASESTDPDVREAGEDFLYN